MSPRDAFPPAPPRDDPAGGGAFPAGRDAFWADGSLSDQSGHRVTLARRDVIVFEKRLKETVAEFVSFKGYSVLFPRRFEGGEASWLAQEEKLLLPLCDSRGNALGVFVARGADPAAAPALLPHWPRISRLLVENLLLYKQSLCDPVTGLYSRHYLLRRMEREMEPARRSGEGLFASGAELPRQGSPGILAVRLAALRDVVREFGYQFADDLMVALADTLTGLCPEQALAARTGDSEFAVRISAATPKACRALAASIVAALRGVYLVHPLRRERVGIAPSVGFALYPQDMDADQFRRPASEQARVLLRKARLAAALAGEESALFPGAREGDAVMGFGRILAEGGRVLETLPLSRVVVSLGAGMHAREGQRFSVWASSAFGGAGGEGRGFSGQGGLTPLYKGELALMEVQEHASQAEVIHLGDPAWNIEPGDRLVLLPDEQGSAARAPGGAHALDPATGLARHGEFLARWAEARERCDAFCLALVRLAPKAPGRAASPPGEASSGPWPYPDGERDGALQIVRDGGAAGDAEHSDLPPLRPDQIMAEAVQLCREELGADIHAEALAGRYGLSSFILFHPGLAPDRAAALYEKLALTLESRLRLDAAVGIAPHPFLDFRKADALENCQKALEYAMLLPRPHVGVLDSLALNIGADKRFSRGDTFGAIKEYQQALLADEGNGMAWNSLGICFAGLGRHAEAERHFTRALACNPGDAMALYNLGYMHQSLGRTEEAEKFYRECLDHAPDHLYAMVRLGQSAENAGRPAAAREFYEKAALLPGGAGITYRHFARLCIAEGKEEEAREHLHEALLHDPQDALAMQLLARLYLDGGEDPDMAAGFARQSVSLRPGFKAGWLELARALEAAGNQREAAQARSRAGEI